MTLVLSFAKSGEGKSARFQNLVTPDQMLEQAMEYLLEDNYADAIPLFKEVLQNDRKNQIAREAMERAIKRKKQIEKSRIEYEKPALAAAKRHYALAEWVEAINRLQDILKRVPDHTKAHKLLVSIQKEVTKLHQKEKPNTINWFFTKGVLAYLDKDWFLAIQMWDNVYAFDPNRVFLLNDINHAKQKLEEQQKDERIKIYSGVAWDHMRKRKYVDAKLAWDEILKFDPENIEAKEGSKAAEEGLERETIRTRADEAQQMTQEAIESYIDKDFKKSSDLWARILEYDPGNDVAKDYLKRIEESKNSPKYYSAGYKPFTIPTQSSDSGYKKALDFINGERYADAIYQLEKFTRNNPDHLKAKELLENTRQTQQELAERLYKSGLTSYSQGNPGEAIKSWREALRIHPEYQKARQALIKALVEAKK
ncbi:MAG TPA: hypothetical protein PK876_05150 [Elusimicrobiota bacterium]|nr:hypothetical protein [Elusimicrobiota bacterium]